MKSMLSVYLTGAKKLELIQEPIPKPSADKVLIKIRVIGICGSDMHYYEHGRIGSFVPTGPLVLGHESSGEVVEVGKEVKEFKTGDRVTLEPGISCGKCEMCKRGRYNLCADVYFMGSAPDQHGAFREYLVWDPRFVYKLPDMVSYEEAALIEPSAAALHAARLGSVKTNDCVGIYGCGPIGLLISQMARIAGASAVYMSDFDSYRLSMAVKFGANKAIPANKMDMVEILLKETNGIGADVVFEAAGSPQAHQASLKLARKGGTVVFVGWTSEAKVKLDLHEIGVKELNLRGMFRYCNVYPEAISLAAKGMLNLKDLITHRFTLKDIEKAINFASQHQTGTGKILIYNE